MTRNADEHPVADDNGTNDALAATLQSLGRWDRPEPEPPLWQRAMEQYENVKAAGSASLNSTSIFTRVLRWPVPKAMAAGLAVVIGLGVLATVLIDSGKAREQASVLQRYPATASVATNSAVSVDRQLQFSNDNYSRTASTTPAGRDLGIAEKMVHEGSGHALSRMATDSNGQPFYAASDKVGANPSSGVGGGGAQPPFMNGQEAPFQASSNDSAESRSVVRRATIELIVSDVRGSFIKAMHLVSEAGGEYVQDSALTGSEATAQGNLTLRVRADRLGAVLNELRQLGKVSSEQLGGDDVTAQMVDLDARHRNECRVETELLELLEKRSDAPLKEILELRDQIARVRQTIEQLTAQQERLSRLVSLATVLVLIRPEPKDDAPPPPTTQPEKTLGQYFSESISSSWHNGLLFLADTLANLLRVFVGGIIWWIALFAILLAARSHWRAKLERAATM